MIEALAADLPGARVLELFAGTGALGLEAVSRGAKWVDFVENGPASLHALKANVAALRVREKARIYKLDAIPFVERLQADAYDVCLMDPPYGSQKLDRIVAQWRRVPFATVLCAEYAADHPTRLGGQALAFGDTRVMILRAPSLGS